MILQKCTEPYWTTTEVAAKGDSHLRYDKRTDRTSILQDPSKMGLENCNHVVLCGCPVIAQLKRKL